MVVANNLKVKTLPELIEYGKVHPGELTFANWTGVGEMARKGLELRTGLTMTLVPYKGMVDAMTDIIAGRASGTIVDLGLGAALHPVRRRDPDRHDRPDEIPSRARRADDRSKPA